MRAVLPGHNYQLTGGPAGVRREYFEIEAGTAAPATKMAMRTMLQTLLSNRFKLKVRRGVREIPVYTLVVGNSGLKLKVSREPCGEDGCINVATGVFMVKNIKMDSVAATLSNMVEDDSGEHSPTLFFRNTSYRSPVRDVSSFA